MAREITATWLQQLLEREDPLAVWSGVGRSGSSDYQREAQLAAVDLRELLGLGHAFTIVADAIDRVHPGFYQAVDAATRGDELRIRLGRIARGIWDRHGIRLPSERPSPMAPPGPLPSTPPVDDLIHDGATLTGWLRGIEVHLAAEVNRPGSPPGPAASALLSLLPQIVDAYLEAGDEGRARMRLAFSRFLRVCHRLSSFAAMQLRLLDGQQGPEALRRCLVAESLLDMNVDWRDELMLLRDVRRIALSQGLPFEAEVERAAGCSSAETARFLRGLLAAG